MPSAVCLVDTSIFCEILRIPGKSQNPKRFLGDLKERIGRSESLLLPMATVFETGNHISQLSDGNERRRVAGHFVDQVAKALDGRSPFTPTPMLKVDEMRPWLEEFPDAAMRELSLGDLTIIKEWERQCAKNPGRRVYVWAKDSDLSGYDRAAGSLGT